MKNLIMDKLNHSFLHPHNKSIRKSNGRSNESLSHLTVDTNVYANDDEIQRSETNNIPLVGNTEVYLGNNGENCIYVQKDEFVQKCSEQPMINTNSTDVQNIYLFEQQVCTPVMTPTNISEPISRLNRQDSVSSLASSVSEYRYTNRSGLQHNGSQGLPNFSPKFIYLLLDIYSQVCSDPTVTPFDMSNPPTEILNRVSKVAVARAEREQLEIGVERNSWLLFQIRQRLLCEVRKESFISRNSSIVSLPPILQRGFEGNLTSEKTSSSSSQHDYFGFIMTEMKNQSINQQQQNTISSGLNSPFETRPCSQASLMHNRTVNQQANAQHQQTLGRTRNNSFISTTNKSGSNSFLLHPQLNTGHPSGHNIVHTQHLPYLSRSRSTSNGSNLGQLPVAQLPINEVLNFSKNGECGSTNVTPANSLAEKNYHMHPHKNYEDNL